MHNYVSVLVCVCAAANTYKYMCCMQAHIAKKTVIATPLKKINFFVGMLLARSDLNFNEK